MLRKWVKNITAACILGQFWNNHIWNTIENIWNTIATDLGSNSDYTWRIPEAAYVNLQEQISKQV